MAVLMNRESIADGSIERAIFCYTTDEGGDATVIHLQIL